MQILSRVVQIKNLQKVFKSVQGYLSLRKITFQVHEYDSESVNVLFFLGEQYKDEVSAAKEAISAIVKDIEYTHQNYYIVMYRLEDDIFCKNMTIQAATLGKAYEIFIAKDITTEVYKIELIEH